MKIIPVILSGGSGTRLWPLSRRQLPKQFLKLVSDNTLLQETMLRLKGFEDLSEPIIVCNSDHRFIVAEQLQQIGVKNPVILLEPAGRNTAPAIAAAAIYAQKNMSHSLLLVLSADHMIEDSKAFQEAVKLASQQAINGKIVTFGVLPTEPNQEYGYIKISPEHNDGVYKVDEFVEKPDQLRAEKYFSEGNYLWNSGMFIFKSSSLIKELNVHASDIISLTGKAVDNAIQDLDFIRLDAEVFKKNPSVSIDHALMEKCHDVAVVPLIAGWNDIGSWPSLYDVGEKDKNGNVILGDVLTEESINCYVNASNHLVAIIGLNDLVVVDTPDATLISSKQKIHAVKNILHQLEQKERNEQLFHRKVYRPWGWYDSIEMGIYFQVKKLHINPGAKLSLQVHYKRAEHWVVVDGIATVTKGEDIMTLIVGESTYIPIGVKHALENLENTPLELIEVQSGSYLGEDDILRFEDIYGRHIEE